jgi:dTDP-4-dehydrorhamnose 3,5-epimerase
MDSLNKIPGLRVFDLEIHADSRGWFKENWRNIQTSGNDDSFIPVQNNISFNSKAGVTRGFHAEPWDKYVSVTSGRVFCAWIDLRQGVTFGNISFLEITPSKSVFVPAGVANAFQVLEDNTTYTYLVNGYWDSKSKYVSVGLFDPSFNIPWPMRPQDSIISDKDKKNPPMSEVAGFEKVKFLITGAEGQLGRALCSEVRNSLGFSRRQFDICDPNASIPSMDLSPEWIVNSAAFTDVDACETTSGSVKAWSTNVLGQSNLVKLCLAKGSGLISFSSDYVFDGENSESYTERSTPNPVNVYGWTKAAGDAVVSSLPKHYLLRTSWVVGEGSNFVLKMSERAKAGLPVTVVSDQFGRLTFAEDLARAVDLLISARAPYGTYNVTNSGTPASWYEIAKFIYAELGCNQNLVTPISSSEYDSLFPGKARRPKNSVLDMHKFNEATGSETPDWRIALKKYLTSAPSTNA